MAVEGLITIRSSHGPEVTMNRFEAELRNKHTTVFARIDHAAAGDAAGLSLRPTDLLIFGDAQVGRPLMPDVQTIGIDLPLKVLVWQDPWGTTSLSYNDPGWLAQRHRLGENAKPAIKAMSDALQAIALKATGS